MTNNINATRRGKENGCRDDFGQVISRVSRSRSGLRCRCHRAFESTTSPAPPPHLTGPDARSFELNSDLPSAFKVVSCSAHPS